MEEEYLAIVDADDQVIGRASRAEIHARGHLHRAVHLIVQNSLGEVFVQRRSFTKDNAPGLWDSAAAGHVDYGETYDACAARELEEELGIADVPIEPIDCIVATPATDQEFVWLYKVVTDLTLTLNPEEIIDGRWCQPAALAQWLAAEPQKFTTAFHLIFDRYRAKF